MIFMVSSGSPLRRSARILTRARTSAGGSRSEGGESAMQKAAKGEAKLKNVVAKPELLLVQQENDEELVAKAEASVKDAPKRLRTKRESKLEPRSGGKSDSTSISAIDEDNAEALKKLQKAARLADLEEVWSARSNAPCRDVFFAARKALVHHHGPRVRGGFDAIMRKGSVLDSVVRTVLSQNTTDVNSTRCFTALKERYPTWDDMLAADDAEVIETIKSGGLAKTKTARMKQMFREIRERHGCVSLEHLRGASSDDVKRELSRYKGIGAKTISCVLLFGLQLDDMPVDTHVNRLSRRLGWVPNNAQRDETYAFLNAVVPDELKFEMHILLVEHGKRVCQAGKPRCGECQLQPMCKLGSKRKNGLARKRAKTDVNFSSDEDADTLLRESEDDSA